MELRKRAKAGILCDKTLEAWSAEYDLEPADTSTLLFESATYFSERAIPRIPFSPGESTKLSLSLALASIFLFVASTGVEGERLFNAAAIITHEGRKRPAAWMSEMVVFLRQKLTPKNLNKNKREFFSLVLCSMYLYIFININLRFFESMMKSSNNLTKGLFAFKLFVKLFEYFL